jgi:hypothetical protein
MLAAESRGPEGVEDVIKARTGQVLIADARRASAGRSRPSPWMRNGIRTRPVSLGIVTAQRVRTV